MNEFAPIKIYIHSQDKKPLLAYKNLVEISDGQFLTLAAEKCIEVLHTPGHSPGECCFLFNKKHLITGDTIFIGNVGRTDFAGGSDEEMFNSIQRIKTLDPEIILYPGHDYGKTQTNTLSNEIKTSAAFQCKSIEELSRLD